MKTALAQALTDEFALATAITGSGTPRRYLWTDAFAVCNFLGLAQQMASTTSDARHQPGTAGLPATVRRFRSYLAPIVDISPRLWTSLSE